jgi:hypothetical protein
LKANLLLGLLLVVGMLVSAGCSLAGGELPVHPRAVESKAACPPEAMASGDQCYHLPWVTVGESITWYKGRLVALGWTAPALPPDDEPFPYYFTKGDRRRLLIFAGYEGGTSLKVSMDRTRL